MKQTLLASITFGTKILLSAGLMGALLGVIAPSEAFSLGTTPPPKKKQTRGAYRAEITRLMQENKVPCKISLDCEALPLGNRACGGPSEFLIISKGTKSKIQDSLSDLTKSIDEMDRTANSEQGLMGTCEAMEKPELTCQSGSCTAQNGSK